MRHWFPLSVFFLSVSCLQQACPSRAGGPCDPRHASCPAAYTCALAEICTRTCQQTSDCWVKVEDGCYYTEWPGQLRADGGVFMEASADGFCPETKLMECLEGHCQRFECLDGGCDYDLYGPSTFKGIHDPGPGR